MKELQTRFELLVNKLTKNKLDPKREWIFLNKKYSEDYRAYHNLTHLTELFKSFDIHKSELNNPNEVAFAIFYHDIIYNIADNKNEEKSGREAMRVLTQMEVDSEIAERINQLILSTKTHEANTEDEKWMMDFDLGILGQPCDIYDVYSKKIRQEYQRIPSLLYKKGRKKVLKHFLDKESIYKTDKFILLYEDQARKNLTQELSIL